MAPNSLIPDHTAAAIAGIGPADPTAETYDDLKKAYQVFNQALFHAQLEPCLITLRARVQLGYFSPYRFRHSDTRKVFAHEIALNPEEFGVHTIEECLSTLVRMQVHQIQHQERTRGRRGYENRDFIERMGNVGLGIRRAGEGSVGHFREKHLHFIMPGGRFIEVARELIDDGFRARWADRFLTHVHFDRELADAIAEAPTSLEPAQAASLPVHTTNVSAERIAPMPLAAHAPGLLETVDDPSPDDRLPPVVRSRKDFIFIPPQRESKKAKFQCPLCKNAAWGKESLNLVCGDCRVYMNRAMDDRSHLGLDKVKRLRVHQRDGVSGS